MRNGVWYRMMLTQWNICSLETALGRIEIDGSSQGIRAVRFADAPLPGASCEELPSLRECRAQLREYFEGKRRNFHDVPLVFHGTDFQQSVWEYMLSVPYGATVSYGEVASAIGSPRSARAVGNALADNPFMILVPCHRVLPSDGSVGHYAGGSVRKEWLLRMEQERGPSGAEIS